MDVVFLLAAYVSYAFVALTIAIVYLSASRVTRFTTDFMYRRRRLVRLMPGEPVRRELRRNAKRLNSHFTACLIAVVTFTLLALLGRRGWWPDWSLRIWATLVVLLLIPQTYGVIKLGGLVLRRWHLMRLLALHDDVAERLGEAQLRGNRVHFAVPSDAGYIDAVVVGPNGVYALLLVSVPRGSESVCLFDGQLRFEPSGETHGISVIKDTIAALAKNIETGSGRRAVIQPVLVVPECQIGPVDDDGILLVNTSACVSFVGWRNPKAFLMDDEVRDIDAWLGSRRPDNDSANKHSVGAFDQTHRFASRVLPQFES
ncbi:MAG: hypothetical protein QNJ73_06950 [Gammaproteobacteria bacterium]|nr:hypothetical protein [Gammaproteobacteria bacterium]